MVHDENALSATQLKAFKNMIDKATADAVATSMSNAAELGSTLIDAMEERLKGISSPVMTVKIRDQKTIKLEQPACAILPELIQCLEAGEAVLIKGPMGCGKTTAASQAAQVLEKTFRRFVFSPDMGVSSLFGRQTMQGFVDSIIIKAARCGDLLLLDEMDNAAPECLLALNPLTDKSGVLYNPVTGEEIPIHEGFRCIAACNTWGLGADHVYTARSRQDGAALSRFTFFAMEYDREVEKTIAKAYTEKVDLIDLLWTARTKLESMNASETISTRHMQRVHALEYGLGWKRKKAIKHAITFPWSAELQDQVGLS